MRSRAVDGTPKFFVPTLGQFLSLSFHTTSRFFSGPVGVDSRAVFAAEGVYRKRRETRFSHYQCLYSGYRLGLCIVACSGCAGAAGGAGMGALAMLMGSSLVELLGDG